MESGGASLVPSTSVRRRGSCFTQAAGFAEHTFVSACAAARDKSTRYAALAVAALKTLSRNSITASASGLEKYNDNAVSYR